MESQYSHTSMEFSPESNCDMKLLREVACDTTHKFKTYPESLKNSLIFLWLEAPEHTEELMNQNVQKINRLSYEEWNTNFNMIHPEYDKNPSLRIHAFRILTRYLISFYKEDVVNPISLLVLNNTRTRTITLNYVLFFLIHSETPTALDEELYKFMSFFFIIERMVELDKLFERSHSSISTKSPKFKEKKICSFTEALISNNLPQCASKALTLFPSQSKKMDLGCLFKESMFDSLYRANFEEHINLWILVLQKIQEQVERNAQKKKDYRIPERLNELFIHASLMHRTFCDTLLSVAPKLFDDSFFSQKNGVLVHSDERSFLSVALREDKICTYAANKMIYARPEIVGDIFNEQLPLRILFDETIYRKGQNEEMFSEDCFLVKIFSSCFPYFEMNFSSECWSLYQDQEKAMFIIDNNKRYHKNICSLLFPKQLYWILKAVELGLLWIPTRAMHGEKLKMKIVPKIKRFKRIYDALPEELKLKMCNMVYGNPEDSILPKILKIERKRFFAWLKTLKQLKQ